MKILIVEDEPDIREILEYNLTKEGYSVISTEDGERGFHLAKKELPDLMLLDLMLPGMDGLELCKKIKGDPSTSCIAIIMVTAKGEESDIVLGLGLGADDYVTKPFSPKELIGRVKAVLRRGPVKKEDGAESRIVHGDLVIDPVRHKVSVKGDNLILTATEFRLLLHLASNPGRVFTRNQLLGVGVGEDVEVIDRNIDVHIQAIRKKLGESKSVIETVRGIGYRFAEF